jgi:predicted secreted protein
VREIRLGAGETHELTLRGLGGAGYSWQFEVDGPEGVLEIRRVPSGPPSPPAEPGGPPPATTAPPEVFELRGAGAGRVTVRFALRRSWEDVPPLEEEELDVVVTGGV